MKKYFIFGALVGIISSTICFLYFLICWMIGNNPLGGVKGFGYLAMIAAIFFGPYFFRKNYLNDEMHFHQGFVVAFLGHFFSCLFYAALQYAYLTLWGTKMLVSYKVESKKLLDLLKSDIGVEQYNAAIANFESMSSINSIVIHDFKWRFGLLLVMVLISAFVTRRSPIWAKSQ